MCSKFGQYFTANIIKIVLSRCQFGRLKCTKFNFSLAPPDPSWIWRRKEKQRRKGKEGGKGRGNRWERGRGWKREERQGKGRGRRYPNYLDESDANVLSNA